MGEADTEIGSFRVPATREGTDDEEHSIPFTRTNKFTSQT
jgi:hypothetical protein